MPVIEEVKREHKHYQRVVTDKEREREAFLKKEKSE
jgi:hypothetical protein